ncbi:MAG: enoyl-CoA hydratase/isomerase family protein [Pseudomonadales bacterium]
MSQPINAPDSVVVLYEHATASGHVLAEARLNVESTLNSLSLEMIDLLAPALTRWSTDSRVVAVLITGTGERAFSAGGDIQALYRAMVRNHEAGSIVDDYPYAFFEREYRLDHQLHNYAKPVIALGHGIVMGGGLGVFGGASLRIVTEKSRIALPEVTIGLFPDAGATLFLGRMPAHVATFMAMTGAHLNGADALCVGLGTHSVAAAERGAVRAELLAADWSSADARVVAERVLASLPAAPLPARQIDVIPTTLNPSGSAAEVAARVAELAGLNSWVDNAIATMQRGCPVSVGVVAEQLKRAPGLAPADAFRMEMIIGTHCANHRDFAEGVRALLIDKDNAPRWSVSGVDVLPAATVAAHFAPPWPQNPLADLEDRA